MKLIIQIAAVLLLIGGCTDDPVETIFLDLDTSQGVFIACEGNFMYGNGSLSFYNTVDKKVTNQLFYARNNVPLGDVVQSVALLDNALFIVVNNSGKIVVADANTVEFKGNITGLVAPRYIHFVSGQKAYVSDLYAGHITVVNPKTLEVTGTISLEGHTSEQMVQIGKYVYTTNWSYGNKMLIIDTEKDELAGWMEVPLQPRDLVVDRNGRIWVLSDGGYEGSPAGNEVPALCRIDPETLTIEQIYRFNPSDAPSSLELNSKGDTLYFLNRHIYKMPVENRHLPESAFINGNDMLFYHLAVDPRNNDVYVADAIDYTQDAVVYRYSATGELIDSFKTGINPSHFMFR